MAPGLFNILLAPHGRGRTSGSRPATHWRTLVQFSRVAADGSLTIRTPEVLAALKTRRPIFLHHRQMRVNFANKLVRVEIVANGSGDPQIRLFNRALARHRGPTYTFYFDQKNEAAYFRPLETRTRQEAEDVRWYPMCFRSGLPTTLNGYTFHKASAMVKDIFQVITNNDGEFSEMRNKNHEPLEHSIVYKQGRKVTDLLVGANQKAAAQLKISGFTGPFSLRLTSIDKEGAPLYKFPTDGSNYVFARDVKKLGIDPTQGIWARYENGHVVEIYSPADQNFENPVFYRIIRNADWEVEHTGRAKIHGLNLNSIIIAEGVETKAFTGKEADARPKEICSFGNKPIHIGMLTPEEAASAESGLPFRHASFIIVNNSTQLLTIHESRFNQFSRNVANEIIRIYRQGFFSQEIKDLAEEACRNQQAGNLDAAAKQLAILKNYPVTAKLSQKGDLILENPWLLSLVCAAQPIALFHHRLKSHFRETNRNEVIIMKSTQPQEDPSVTFYDPIDPHAPICTVHFDQRYNLAYFYRIQKHGEDRSARHYVLRFADAGPIKLWDLDFLRVPSEVANLILVKATKGKFQFVESVSFKVLSTTTVYDSEKKPATVIVNGQSLSAPFDLKVSGYAGPFSIYAQPRPKAAEVMASHRFPEKLNNHLLERDLAALRITPDNFAAGVWALLEDGQVTRVFAARDRNFNRPIYYRVVRDKNWGNVQTGREKIPGLDMSGIKIVEGGSTRLFNPSEPGKSLREYVHIHGKNHPFVLYPSGAFSEKSPFMSRFCSFVAVDNKTVLFYAFEPYFNAFTRRIVNLVIAAHERGLTPGQTNAVRNLAHEVYKSYKTESTETAERKLAYLQTLLEGDLALLIPQSKPSLPRRNPARQTPAIATPAPAEKAPPPPAKSPEKSGKKVARKATTIKKKAAPKKPASPAPAKPATPAAQKKANGVRNHTLHNLAQRFPNTARSLKLLDALLPTQSNSLSVVDVAKTLVSILNAYAREGLYEEAFSQIDAIIQALHRGDISFARSRLSPIDPRVRIYYERLQKAQTMQREVMFNPVNALQNANRICGILYLDPLAIQCMNFSKFMVQAENFREWLILRLFTQNGPPPAIEELHPDLRKTHARMQRNGKLRRNNL